MDNEYKLKPTPSPTTPEEEKEAIKPIVGAISKPEGPKEASDAGIPFSVGYFGVDGWPQMMLEPALDVYGLKDKIIKIENFLTEKIKESGMKDDPDTRKDLLNRFENGIGTGFQYKAHHRINKIHSVIGLMDSFDSERRKKEMMLLFVNSKSGKFIK